MEKILTKSELFENVDRLVDVAAITLYVIETRASNQMFIESMISDLELSEKELAIIESQLRNFFNPQKDVRDD